MASRLLNDINKTEDQIQAFTIQALANANHNLPTLTLPYSFEVLKIRNDTTDVGFGFAIMQELRPVALLIKKFGGTTLKHLTCDEKLNALVQDFQRHLPPVLTNPEFLQQLQQQLDKILESWTELTKTYPPSNDKENGTIVNNALSQRYGLPNSREFNLLGFELAKELYDSESKLEDLYSFCENFGFEKNYRAADSLLLHYRRNMINSFCQDLFASTTGTGGTKEHLNLAKTPGVVIRHAYCPYPRKIYAPHRDIQQFESAQKRPRRTKREEDERFKPPDLNQDPHQTVTYFLRIKDLTLKPTNDHIYQTEPHGKIKLKDFEVTNLKSFCAEGSDLRTNPLEEGGDDMSTPKDLTGPDEDLTAPTTVPHGPSVPATKLIEVKDQLSVPRTEPPDYHQLITEYLHLSTDHQPRLDPSALVVIRAD